MSDEITGFDSGVLDPAAVKRMIGLMDPDGLLDFSLPAQSIRTANGGTIAFFRSTGKTHMKIRGYASDLLDAPD